MDSRKRVLVVDDDPDVLRVFIKTLTDHAEVKVAFGAEAALQALGGETFEAVVVDFNMSGPNGDWLLRKIREGYPNVQRILLSGSTYAELARHLEPGLVDRFIQKPVDIDALIEAVQAI